MTPASFALELPHSHTVVAALHPDHVAFDKGPRDLLPSRCENPLESRSGDVHAFGTFLLLKAFQIL
jgi:hypothetical protein